MGAAKNLFLLIEVVVWVAIIGVILLGSGLTVSMGGGVFPSPSVGGVSTLPTTTLALTTGGFAFLMVLTEVVMP